MKLSETPLFRGISDTDCARMARCFDAAEREFSAGQAVYDFAQGADGVGILVQGKAEVVRLDIDGNRTILETLGAGDAFGAMFTFYSETGDSVAVVCTQRCRVVYIGRDQITKRCQKACLCHSRLVENLLELASAKAMYLSARVEILSRRTIRDKLLCYFRYCCRGREENAFVLPFSWSSLAEYISIDRSAMMRELRKLREEGLVEAEGRRVWLKTAGMD